MILKCVLWKTEREIFRQGAIEGPKERRGRRGGRGRTWGLEKPERPYSDTLRPYVHVYVYTERQENARGLLMWF